MNKNRLNDIHNSDTTRPTNGHTMAHDFTTRPSGATFTQEIVAVTNARVTASGVLDLLAAWRSEERDGPGRRPAGVFEDKATSRRGTQPGLISDRAILVGLLLLAAEDSPLQISALADVFHKRLPDESAVLLGLPTPTSIENGISRSRWYDRTRRAFHRMLALMDPFRQARQHALTYSEIKATLDDHNVDLEQTMKARLDEFTKVFLQMTYIQQPQHIRDASNRISLSIGQTFIQSPTPVGFSRKKLDIEVRDERANPLGAKPKKVDVFAGWYPREWRNDRANLAWGWAANVAVRVDSEQPGHPRVPEIVVGTTMSMPGAQISEERMGLPASRALIGRWMDDDQLRPTHGDTCHLDTSCGK
jgi:hypothetical protein